MFNTSWGMFREQAVRECVAGEYYGKPDEVIRFAWTPCGGPRAPACFFSIKWKRISILSKLCSDARRCT